MSAPRGSAASSSIEASGQKPILMPEGKRPLRGAYMQRLALRREAAEIHRLISYGLTIGWILTLVAGFLFFCVKSRLDWLWCSLMLLGIGHLVLTATLPQALAWPERIWMAIARWQGHIVMAVLLSAVYYLLLWPASRLSRSAAGGFFRWAEQPPATTTAWQAIELSGDESQGSSQSRYRGLPILLLGVIGFFIRRGNYILLPIVILLIVLGLVLFIVQSSVLAPFIYPLF
jgi:hypothetical protein